MKTQYTGQTEGQHQTTLANGIGSKLLTGLRSLTQAAPVQHVGMFAGSLLPYAAWAQPKVPH